MHHALIERYSRLSSPVHRVPIAAKLAVTVMLLVSAVVPPVSNRTFFLSMSLFLFFTALLSRIPVLFLVKKLLFLELFVVGTAALSLLQVNGLAIFLTVMLRSTLCLCTVFLFSHTTPFTELLRSLRRWRAPDLMITIVALMYRYLFVMVDELERMQGARKSRTFVKARWTNWMSLSTVVVQLFIRSSERAERVYAAMCARGWK